MPRTKISEFSATAADNTDIDGINLGEGMLPSDVNNAIRELMSQLKDLQAGTSGDTIPLTAGGTGATTASAARTALGLAIGTNVQAFDADTTKNDVANTFTVNQIVSVTDNSNAALRITQLGTGNALVVEDETNPDASPFVIDASGTTTIGGNPPSAGKLGIVGALGGIAIAISDNVNSSAYFRTATGGALIGTDAGGNLHLAGGGNTTAERALTVSAAQNIGIGITSPAAGFRFQIGGTYAGSTTTRGASIAGSINPAVSTSNHTQLFITSTVSAGTLPALYYTYATQGTFTGTVTNQFGYVAESNLTGATNNYGFYGNIASGTGRFNLYMAGTAANYMAGALGIGTTPIAGVTLQLGKNITGAATSIALYNNATIQSDVSTAYLNYTNLNTQATAFTVSGAYHYGAFQGTIGASSTVTSQFGYFVSAITGATNNYGFYGNIAAASGRWNLYMNGTAANYFGGDMQFNKTVTAAGTTGAQTISKNAGTVNFAAAATSLVVTNTLVTTNSIIICTVGTNDTTMKSASAVAGSGSFTIHSNAAATAETRVNFIIIN